jgi:hypothetical protein
MINSDDINIWRDPHSKVIALNSDISLAFNFTATGINNVAVNGSSISIRSHVCSKTLQPNGNYGCINPSSSNFPSIASLVSYFASYNAAFLTAFATSYVKMSSIGCGSKLTSLTIIDLSTC